MPNQTVPSSPARWVVAGIAAISVFILVVITATLWTFIIPETFVSSSRILLQAENGGTAERMSIERELATQIELMQSDVVLGAAASELDLGQVWGKQYAGGERLREPEVLLLLRRRLDVRPVRNTSLVEIKVYSGSPREAADIANQIAAAYCSPFANPDARIVDRAMPGLRPVRPNKPLNIALGTVIGALVGGLTGVGVLFLRRGKRG
jgi:uncharacterized protein involved in exopolysaccharide biosynthesis